MRPGHRSRPRRGPARTGSRRAHAPEWFAPLALASALLCRPAVATEPARPRLDLRATLDPAARRLEGTARWTFTNTSAVSLPAAQLWLYPNHLREPPASLTDINFHWFYPAGFSPGSMTIRAARAGGQGVTFDVRSSTAGRDTRLSIPLPIPLPPGAATTIEIDFATTVPERLGTFGCANDACTLAGGFTPFPLALGTDGFVENAPADHFDLRASIMAPHGSDVVLGSTVALRSTGTVSATDLDAATLPLLVRSGFAEDDVTAAGRTVRFLHPAGRRPPSSDDQVLPYAREDRVGLVLEAARQALEHLAASGLEGNAAEPHQPLVLVEAPLRHTLVTARGPVVLISDRLFRLFPLDRLRRYHRRELARAIIAAAVDARLRRGEPDPDLDLAAEVIGSHLSDSLDVVRFRHLELARELLRPLAFLPAVDQLLYAPLVASPSSYFGDTEDRERDRDDVTRFSHARPDGRFVHAKLLDLLGTAGVAQVARLVLEDGIPLRQAAARVFGAPLDWFWAEWLAPAPARVNYRLTAVRTSPLGGPGVHVVIDVEREGADLLEPVEVQVTARDGATHELVWADRERRHRFELDLPAGLDAVELDPRRRLVESAVGSLHPDDDPLSDNRRPRRLRFIYSGFGALVDLTSLQAQAAAALTLKPQHDLHNAVYLVASHSPPVLGGLSAAYERRFGHQADANRLTSGAGLGLAVERLNPDFGIATGEAPQPGWHFGASLLFDHDDRDYFIDPWRAFTVAVEAGTTLTALDRGDRLLQLYATADVARLHPLAPGHVLAVDFQAAATVGDIQRRAQLLHLGGPAGLRGFGFDELLGRARAAVRVELRDRYVSDLDWNLAHFTAVRGFGGNLFAEAGAIAGCESLSFSARDVFYDVGYTFRVLHDGFGVYQQMLAIDLAVPLNRHDRVCFGEHSLGAPADGQPSFRRPPFSILLSFLPAF